MLSFSPSEEPQKASPIPPQKGENDNEPTETQELIHSLFERADLYPESGIRPVQKRGTIETAELPKRQEVLAIGDIEANDKALLKILEKSGYIDMRAPKESGEKKQVFVTEKGRSGTVIQTGDFFDRGSDLLRMLKHVQQLQRHGLDFRFTAGNHDLYALNSLCSPYVQERDPEFFRVVARIIEKLKDKPKRERRALMEKAINEEIRKTGATLDPGSRLLEAQIFAAWQLEGGDACTDEIQRNHFPDENNVPLSEVARQGYQLFFDGGEFSGVMEGLSAIEQVDNVAYLHAGIDDVWAKEIIAKHGVEGANQLLRHAIRNQQLGPFAYGALKRLFWQRSDYVCEDTARILKQRGIDAIVRGHDVQKGGKQTISNYHDIQVISNDIGIGKTEIPNTGGTIVTSSGHIVGFHHGDYENRQIIGTLPENRNQQGVAA